MQLDSRKQLEGLEFERRRQNYFLFQMKECIKNLMKPKESIEKLRYNDNLLKY